ncbi:uncharacterized protein LOC124267194 [Haliotis rubra]|uniref:uncharacterized protein LOC124267194 n=1 Tax=Haliotis rubra TaxID=36100 RepID=UPI001EE5B78E|nr:uncharacterized protein LOC124267194 [Haliotis rubra]
MAARRRATANPVETKPTKEVTEGVTKTDNDMSFQEKIEYIDQEIRKLHVFCVNSGYSSTQIEGFVDPFTQSMKSVNRERWTRRAIRLAIFVAVAAALFYIDPVYKLICVVGKKSAISVLPVWDWTKIYHSSCLVENPYYSGGQLTTEDCELCESLTGIERVRSLSQDDILDMYLKRDLPVIVEDGTKGWIPSDEYSIAKIAQAYQLSQVLREHSSCSFNSNLRQQYKEHRKLLNKAAKGEITNYFAHWENCFADAAKAFRYLYKRPYFLPPTVEIGISNFVFIASNYTGKVPKKIDMAQSMVVLAQVKGTMQVTVRPREPCNTVCESMKETLSEGEIFVVTDMLWSLEYVPHAKDESITIGLGGSFD